MVGKRTKRRTTLSATAWPQLMPLMPWIQYVYYYNEKLILFTVRAILFRE